MRVLLLCLLLVAPAMARDLTPEEKRSEFEQIASVIRSQYGPLEFKKRLFKTNLKAMVDAYAKKAEKASNVQFYYMVNQFVAEFQDSHFGASLKTNRMASLGFFTDRVRTGRGSLVLIDSIDRNKLDKKKFPFERGDEVVAIDGVPAADIVASLAKHIGAGYKETALRSATMMLTNRMGARVPVPSGEDDVELTIRRGDSRILETVTLEWMVTGDPIEDSIREEVKEVVPMNYDMISINDFYKDIPKSEYSFRCSPTTRIKIPKDATILMMKPFVAYYHKTAKGNVGYLRIPHYYWRDAQGNFINDLRFEQYEWAVDQLEKNTVGLVIDQDHNCGGSVYMVENMYGLFAQKPFKGLEFQFLATRHEYLSFNDYSKTDHAKTIRGADWAKVVQMLKGAWLDGKNMSPKTTFAGGRLLEPNRITYTKPILVLIDEMSGSGGDAFPAMMQGHGRAKLFGHRTMGAGGHVQSLAGGLNYSANNLRLTKSLFYRPDGVAVENNGVVPDIQYDITRNDFVYGYQEYQKAYLDALAKMIP